MSRQKRFKVCLGRWDRRALGNVQIFERDSGTGQRSDMVEAYRGRCLLSPLKPAVAAK